MCVMWWVFIKPSDVAVVVRHWVVIKPQAVLSLNGWVVGLGSTLGGVCHH